MEQTSVWQFCSLVTPSLRPRVTSVGLSPPSRLGPLSRGAAVRQTLLPGVGVTWTNPPGGGGGQRHKGGSPCRQGASAWRTCYFPLGLGPRIGRGHPGPWLSELTFSRGHTPRLLPSHTHHWLPHRQLIAFAGFTGGQWSILTWTPNRASGRDGPLWKCPSVSTATSSFHFGSYSSLKCPVL